MSGAKWSLGLFMLAAIFAAPSFAGEGNEQPQQRRFDPEQFRKMMLDRTKEQLGLTDEEMKAIQPKIEAVQKAQSAARTGGGFGGFGGRGGRGGRGGETGAPGGTTATPAAQPSTENLSDTQKKSRELSTLLENKEADPAAVKAKLAEVREAREKARVELKKAQDELKELLTPRQEAQLVMMGMLE